MKRSIALVASILIIVTVIGCSKSNNSSKDNAQSTPPSPPPQLHITTENGIAAIDKDIYSAGQFEAQENSSVIASGNLEIRGRGNSTWQWPKKPYRIKLETATEMFGLSASKHWVLLANYADKTLIRNDVAFYFSRKLGFEYTVNDKHIDLYINGEYEGIYQLVEQIRLAKNRVAIDELKSDDTDPLLITGGYLLEMDSRMATDFCQPSGQNSSNSSSCLDGVNIERAQTFCVDSTQGMSPICPQDPDNLLEFEQSAKRDYITQYLHDTENALFGDSFADDQIGYAAFLDVDSVVNYYIISEFFKNVEGAYNSFHMYKKRDGKLFFGPVWDFDLAMGINWFSEGQIAEGWVIRNSPWFERLFEDPAFEAKVKARWRALEEAGEFEGVLEYIQERTTWMSSRQGKNFSRWPITTIELWLPTYGSYTQEATKILNWQRDRYNWLNEQFLID